QTGNDGCNHDALTGDLRAQALRESDRGELGTAIWQQVGHADLAANGGDIHNPAGVVAFHCGQDRKGGINNTPEIDVHRFFKVFDCLFLVRSHTDDPGVVDQYIDFAKAIAHLFDQPLNAFTISYVADHIQHLGSALFELNSAA